MKPSELPGTRTNGTLASLAGTDEQGAVSDSRRVCGAGRLPSKQRSYKRYWRISNSALLARKKRTLWTDSVPERPPLEKI